MKICNKYHYKQMLLEEMRTLKTTGYDAAIRCGVHIALRCLEDCPDVPSVAQTAPKGRWLRKWQDVNGEIFPSYHCSQCGRSFADEENLLRYCGNCGQEKHPGVFDMDTKTVVFPDGTE